MTINSVSNHFYNTNSSFQTSDQNQLANDPRTMAHADGADFSTTMNKVLAVATAIFASLFSFSAFGPLFGILVTLISGTVALWTINSNNADSQSHGQHPLSFLQPFFQGFNNTGAPVPQPYPKPASYYPPNVQVNGGHFQQTPPVAYTNLPDNNPHVVVDGGHDQSTPWYAPVVNFFSPRTQNNPTRQPVQTIPVRNSNRSSIPQRNSLVPSGVPGHVTVSSRRNSSS
jgi:hypothetical protein